MTQRLERFLALAEAEGAWSGIGPIFKPMILGQLRKDPERTCRRISDLVQLWQQSEET